MAAKRRTAKQDRRGQEERRRSHELTREFILTERERMLLREVIREQRDHLGIEDAQLHREHHEWWEKQRPLLDEVLPWVQSQKDISHRKLEFWSGIKADLLKWMVTWGVKGALVFVLLAVGFGGLRALGVIGTQFGLNL